MPPVTLGALAARLPRTPLTRFAPSPTGYLHLGHVVNAIWVWGLARALEGRVLLRLEDHDRGRCRSDYEAALLEDLDWLGLAPDLGPTRQRDATAVYLDTLAALERRGLVYACDCSRRDISREGGDVPHLETRYPGRCRDRGLPSGEGRGQRLRLADTVERFTDELLGPQEQVPALQCGDPLLRDRHGNWTYQFAVVVDDLRQGVDLVVRGADLVGSTGRQIALGRLLGRDDPPVYLHHPLLRRPDGAKLSKAAGDTGIRELRAAGVSAPAVLGRAAEAAGLTTDARPLPADELARLFTGA
ncbi:MAG TPA: glutamate--tRNA ligase family protein [Gemmatimonadales bacterium]|nr:glutamate--tRNA ligase family protein [Gemmatimonadales bacterium]